MPRRPAPLRKRAAGIAALWRKSGGSLSFSDLGKKALLFLKKKKQKDFAPAGVGTGIAYNRHLRWRL